MLTGIADAQGRSTHAGDRKEPIGEPQISYLKEHQYQFRGLTFQDSFLRHYPHGDLAAQLFGYVVARSRSRS